MSRLAIAHEWLASRAGSEKTFEAMAAALPGAELFALTRDPAAAFEFGGRPVGTTFLDRLGPLRDRRALTLPLMPLAWRALGGAGDFDVVLTSAHACVRAFPPARDALHFSYTYAPMRYAWNAELDSRASFPGLGAALGGLRRWDGRKARTVDHFAAISIAVRDRIAAAYGRDSVIIAPPVDVEYFTPGPEELQRRETLFAFSRWIPYKRLDLAIRAAALVDLPIVVAGSGPEDEHLRAVAREVGARATFEVRPSDERVRELYRTSLATVFPANEDFGIVPVESQACGTPVVALDEGGSRDTVLDGETGRRVAEATPEAFADAIRELLRDPPSAQACRAHAETFSVARFRRRIVDWLGDNGAADAVRAAGATYPSDAAQRR